MLDGLEATNWSTELDAVLGVVNRGIKAALCATNLLSGQANGDEVKRLRQTCGSAAISSNETSFNASELETSLLAGLVHGW